MASPSWAWPRSSAADRFAVFRGSDLSVPGRDFLVVPGHLRRHLRRPQRDANNGLLYTAKGTSALVVPLADLLVTATGTWTAVLLLMAVSSLGARVLAKLAVESMRRRMPAPGASPVAAARAVAAEAI
jgi:hypothetical protein